LQEAQRLTLEGKQDMRGVLNDDELMFLGELDDALIKLARGHLAGRAVWIVEYQHLGLFPNIVGDFRKVWEEVIFGEEIFNPA
jgi:hypothetical protein